MIVKIVLCRLNIKIWYVVSKNIKQTVVCVQISTVTLKERELLPMYGGFLFQQFNYLFSHLIEIKLFTVISCFFRAMICGFSRGDAEDGEETFLNVYRACEKITSSLPQPLLTQLALLTCYRQVSRIGTLADS